MIRAILLAILLTVLGSTCAKAATVCTVTSTGVAFGIFSGQEVATFGTATVECSGSGRESFTLAMGRGSSGRFTDRTMLSGANSLTYNLYTDAGHTQIWGDGNAGTSTVPIEIEFRASSTQTINVPIYAVLPAQGLQPPGTYSDTIIASLVAKNGNQFEQTAFLVTAIVEPDCTISATDMSFGTYSGVQLDGQSQIALTCTNGAAWNVGLGAGNFPGATVTSRRMTGPGNTPMAYSLYRDPTRTLNWGNIVGTDTLSGTGTGTRQEVSVYGLVPPSQNLPDGVYQDTIVATVTF